MGHQAGRDRRHGRPPPGVVGSLRQAAPKPRSFDPRARPQKGTTFCQGPPPPRRVDDARPISPGQGQSFFSGGWGHQRTAPAPKTPCPACACAWGVFKNLKSQKGGAVCILTDRRPTTLRCRRTNVVGSFRGGDRFIYWGGPGNVVSPGVTWLIVPVGDGGARVAAITAGRPHVHRDGGTVKNGRFAVCDVTPSRSARTSR
jgi:hypothetical protein